MRIESDIAKALGSEDSEPSAASELEVMSPNLVERFESMEAATKLPPERPSNPTNWVVIVAAAGLALSLLAAAVLAFGGAILSALAFLL